MMRPLALRLAALRASCTGAVVIEVAVIAPMLVLLSAGAFEASSMVARQSELQSAVSEATQIVIAASPETQAELDTIEDVVEASTGLPDGKVTLTPKFRCGTTATLVSATGTCADPETESAYIQIVISDTYSPLWTSFGFGSDLDYSIDQTVQVS